MSFKLLSFQQQKNYATVMRRLGLSETESTHRPVEHPAGKTIVYSSDPAESDVPPKIVTVNSIQEMKKMLGMDLPEPHTEDELPYPETDLREAFFAKVNTSQSREELEASLSDYQKKEIGKAAYAYVQGNSKKVKSYVPLINKLHFPTQIAVFAATEPKVINGTVKITSPNGNIIKWSYPSIIMGPDGKIDQEADFLMQTDILKSQVGPDGDLPINNTPPPYSNPAQKGSSPGQPGQAGGGQGGVVKHQTTGNCDAYCATQPIKGDPGVKGPYGGEATDGAKGRSMRKLTITITESLIGKIIISAAGGNGQDGGRGGDGAPGGKGGSGGDGPSPCGKAPDGPQGEGGKGGKGGDAGDGGDVATITINIPATMPQPPVDLTSDGGLPGQAGEGGTGGDGVPPGIGGDNGAKGEPSDAPQVIFKRLPPS